MSDFSFFEREHSWLQFNERVLQEARDKSNPLYERIFFLAIFSSNLDEFFRVRVSSIRQIKKFKKPLRKKLITKPNRLLKKILLIVHQQQEEFGRIFREEIIPELASHNIKLLSIDEMTARQLTFIGEFYQKEVEPELLMKHGINTADDCLFVQNETLYAVSIKEGKLLLIKFPDQPRFIDVPDQEGQHFYCYIDDILKNGLSKQFGVEFYTFKVSRDAELYIDDELHGNLKEKIDDALSKRETGQITRMLIEEATPLALVNALSKAFDVNETAMIYGGQYHNFSDFFGFPNPIGDKLNYDVQVPLVPKELKGYDSMFEMIREKDRLLYFPYESFDSVIQLVREAADDPHVTKIKITLYRISPDSEMAKALVRALRNGKKVVTFIETKARFDEANNIYWGKVLEDEGAKVVYSLPAIKVHSKVLYIEREVNDKLERYCYIGTGNFNEKTAKIYTDFGLMTTHERIAKDLQQVFYLLESRIIFPKLKTLLVSPYNTKSTFEDLIEAETELAKAGKAAYIIAKMNALEDKDLIKLLYEASNAGVKIQLLVRGFCCLIPGVKGQSENIQVTSIVARFLEHARVYMFGNDGNEKMFIGSADWMTRNLERRIEVITEIFDHDVANKIREIVHLQLHDNVKARLIDQKQTNLYVNDENLPLNSQEEIYMYLKTLN